MLEAVILAGIATAGLIVGYLLFQTLHPGKSVVGLVMGLGAGLLMAVVAYSLVQESVETSGEPVRVAVGVAAGAIVYFLSDRLFTRKFGSKTENSGIPLALGAILDGIPESLVIGISVALTGDASIPLVAAAFIANIAESVAATQALEEGEGTKHVFPIWLAIAIMSVAAAAFGYGVISNLGDAGGVAINGFAGGAVLMVLANAMIPDGYKFAGRTAGLLVVLGFAIGFALEHA